MQDIYINEAGKGFPLVLVHGFLGSSELWRIQVEFLKKYFKVITLDLPGFGKSNKAKPLKNIYSMAEFVSKSIKEKKINKFHLLGHSMGGMIVQSMAQLFPDKVDKLICYSTGPIGEMPDRFETIEETRMSIKKKGLEETIKECSKTWFLLGEGDKSYKLMIKVASQTNLDAADKSLIAMKEWNGVKDLKNIKQKTLILWGDKDRSYNLKQEQILKDNIENSKLIILPNCSHNIHLEQPDKFNQIIKHFLIS
jgi:pimeloyl-ACP methyl ester carboxylesterase